MSRFRRLAKGGASRWVAATVLLASNWLFQGLLIMHPGERRFKLLLDAAGTAVAASALALLAPGLGWAWTLLLALAIAHTANWLGNGQLPVVLKNLRLTRLPRARVERELDRLGRRCRRSRCVRAAYVFGSLVRGAVHEGSDLDVRLVRGPGLRAWWGSGWFVLAERARATALLLPLDIYVADDEATVGRGIRADELAAPHALHAPEARA